jgi:hypothetical protein
MFTATWAVKYYRAEVKKLLVTDVRDGDLINALTSGANRAAKLPLFHHCTSSHSGWPTPSPESSGSSPTSITTQVAGEVNT